jgi:hypothetical protein
MNQFQIICGMKPLKCPSDTIRSLSESVSAVLSSPTIGESHKEYKEDDDVIPPLSDTKTMPELAKQCQNAIREVCFIEKLCHRRRRDHKRINKENEIPPSSEWQK